MNTLSIYILVVIFHVNSGSTIEMQEFNSKQACEVAVQHIVKERERTKFSGLESISCIPK